MNHDRFTEPGTDLVIEPGTDRVIGSGTDRVLGSVWLQKENNRIRNRPDNTVNMIIARIRPGIRIRKGLAWNGSGDGLRPGGGIRIRPANPGSNPHKEIKCRIRNRWDRVPDTAAVLGWLSRGGAGGSGSRQRLRRTNWLPGQGKI
jgi:hypothetical protein